LVIGKKIATSSVHKAIEQYRELKKELAIENYKKSIELNRKNYNAVKIL